MSDTAAKGVPATRPVSQCDRILQILADGEPHSFHEILRTVPCIVHSRVADLRKRGHLIECDKTGGDYRYRLLRSATTDDHDLSAAGSPPHLRVSVGPVVADLSGAGTMLLRENRGEVNPRPRETVPAAAHQLGLFGEAA